MKKFLIAFIALSMVSALIGCTSDKPAETSATTAATTEEETAVSTAATEEETTAAATESIAESEDETVAAAQETESGEIMTHAEYIAAEIDSKVVIEAYVQATQSWWEDKITVYAQDEDGAYFLYEMACSEEDSEKLVPGTKIRVSGFKTEWSGEIEIIDATFEIIDGNFIASARDVTSLLGSDELIDYQNEFVSFKGLTVEAAGEDENADAAFLYSWDGSGEDGDDLYFNVSVDGETYTFTVESYLCDKTTDVYAAVKELKIGDKIDAEGFLYWYEGVNPHITAVTPAQ